MMEKLARMAMLFDFYGQLLTDKQREMMGLFYDDDLSLSEIAQEHGISRQAVYDNLKRTENILEDYENKLHLVEKFRIEQNKIAGIAELVDRMQVSGNLDDLARVAAILQEINELERK